MKNKRIIQFTAIAGIMALGLWGNKSLAAEETNITDTAIISDGNGNKISGLLDDSVYTHNLYSSGEKIIVSSNEKISGIYIKWNKVVEAYSLETESEVIQCGQNGFLHEYIMVNNSTGSFTITVPEGGADICDIYIFKDGELPDWVQVWNPPCEEADILFLPTHGDDEILFFGGAIPYYAGELGLQVQVVYLTNHWGEYLRPHEQLEGLWLMGVRSYPIMGPFADLYSESLEQAQSVYNEEDMIEYQVETIRRFKPLVILAHDFNGEYGHGGHMINTYTLAKALELSNDPANYPESAEEYGVWDVPKTYVHLYKENSIRIQWDQPLDYFEGLTGFEVAKKAYLCHDSQQYCWFTVNRESSTTNCCDFGLYRSTVGEDIEKNDFLENVTIYENISKYENKEVNQKEFIVHDRLLTFRKIQKGKRNNG